MATAELNRVDIEGIAVQAIPGTETLFNTVLNQIQDPQQSLILALNVHGANVAYQRPDWRKILNQSDLLYCDGAGIVWASKLLGTPLPPRLTAADWLLELLAFLAQNDKTVYFLAGEPEVTQRAHQLFDDQIPKHSVIGAHHGYILKDPALEQQVIDEINRLKPDLLFVGFGMPLQEYWIAKNRHRLNVKAIWAIGATLDYLTHKVPRCPVWMGQAGLEWLFRFCIEPRRMFQRYIMGNPWFMGRILLTAIQLHWKNWATPRSLPAQKALDT